jgi:hypothetical protein
MNVCATMVSRGFRLANPQGCVAVCLWLLMGCASGVAVGNDLETGFEEANRRYEQGEYESAAKMYYRLLADAPGTASLHFNLGNAWFKAGQVGHAIWHYRAARDLSPRDVDVRANLAIARREGGGSDSVGENRARRWISSLTLDEWGVVSLLCFWGGMGAMAMVQLRPRYRRLLTFWARILILLWLGSAVALACVWQGLWGQRIGIAIGEVPVRYGPFEESQVQFTAKDGTEWRVLEARDRWIQVDNERVVGWVDRSLVRIYPEDR